MKVPEDPVQAKALAADPGTSPDVLCSLAKSRARFIRDAAILNLSTPREFVEGLLPRSLGTATSIEVATAIVGRADLSEPALNQILSLLQSDHVNGSRREHWPVEQLAVAVVTHKNCPPAAFADFLRRTNPSTSLRKRFAEGAVRAEILQHLEVDRSASVRKNTKRT